MKKILGSLSLTFASVRLCGIIVFSLYFGLSSAQVKTISKQITYRLFLIGDAGNDTTVCSSLSEVAKSSEKDPNATVILLGDNVYPKGVEKGNPNSERVRISEKKMGVQIDAFNDFTGQFYVIPGNHDWKKSRWGGLKGVKNERAFVDTFSITHTQASNKGAVMFPGDGLPGPVMKNINPYVNMIMIDTDWWLQGRFFHPIGRERINGRKLSKHQADEKFFVALDSLLNIGKTTGKWSVIVAHHPVYTNGRHQQSYTVWRNLVNYTPMQIFGLLGVNRLLTSNIYQPCYKEMRKKLKKTIDKYDHVIYASGHDHNLQYFHIDSNFYVVSGAGSKGSQIKKEKFKCECSCDHHKGYAIIEFKNGKEADLHFNIVGPSSEIFHSKLE